jgi:hypothetical protein
MGIRLRNITRQISLKNVNPVARVISIVQPTAQQVIETKTIGIKDVVALSPIGLASSLTNTGTSLIKEVVMDKPIEPEAIVQTNVDTTTKPDKPTSATTTPVVAVAPAVKKKPNTLMYAGIGVGVLVLGYFGYKLIKK